MGLNIVVDRRVDLSDFGQGWDGCFLIVRAMNSDQLEEYQEKILGVAQDDTASTLMDEKLSELIIGGKIMNTDQETGKAKSLMFDVEDVPDVVAALGLTFKQRALMVSAGTYGLKGVS
uniref:hypothetical protein n=1 Tax=Rhodococcus qingshengii TaxID=334542 RepID=UPI001C4E2498|nr:hypothetical protein [Rhodococcus qingshengii]